VVRTGKDTKSAEHPDGRLATGSVVVQLELDGERLRYTLLTGEGPREGWVGLKFKNTALLTPAGEKGTKAYKEEQQVKKAIESYGTEGAKRVWLMPQGTRGDVQPVVAFGVGLRKAGFEVRIFASANFKGFVESYGLQFTAQGVDMKKIIEKQTERFKDAEELKETSKKMKEDKFAAGNDLLADTFADPAFAIDGTKILLGVLETEKPDLIFTHCLNGVIPIFAWKKYGIPVVTLEFFPSIWSDDSIKKSAFEDSKRLSALVAEAVGFDALVDPDVEFEEFKLWNLTRSYSAVDKRIIDVLGAEYDDKIRDYCRSFCNGFLVLDPALQMRDTSQFGGPDGLKRIQDYLDAGPPPVYIGFGSMPIPTAVIAKFMLTLRILKFRAVICAGWGGHDLDALKTFMAENDPKDEMGLVDYATNHVLYVGVCPHEWLFRRCSATIHHGGAGTTCAALRAGVPTVLVPCGVDQFAYADWVCKLGCGFQLSMLEGGEKMMDPVWSKTLRKAVTDPEVIAKAKTVGEDLRSQDAVQTHVALAEALVKEARGREAGHRVPFF